MKAKDTSDNTKTTIIKKFNVARVLVFLLFLYLIVCFCIYIYKEPVRHFEIAGNDLLSDVDVLRIMGVEDYPPFVSISSSGLEKKLKNNDLIKDAKVSYGFHFAVKVTIEENKPVFIAKESDQICLADGSLIPYSSEYVGIPILLNNTPKDVMKVLASNLNKVDTGILYMINDIEYKPSYNSDNQVIDKHRFLLSMNDKNLVYVNAKRLKPLNRYLDVIATTKLTQNGVFYLDGDENRYPFKVFDNQTPVAPQVNNESEIEEEVVNEEAGEIINEG